MDDVIPDEVFSILLVLKIVKPEDKRDLLETHRFSIGYFIKITVLIGTRFQGLFQF